MLETPISRARALAEKKIEEAQQTLAYLDSLDKRVEPFVSHVMTAVQGLEHESKLKVKRLILSAYLYTWLLARSDNNPPSHILEITVEEDTSKKYRDCFVLVLEDGCEVVYGLAREFLRLEAEFADYKAKEPG